MRLKEGLPHPHYTIAWRAAQCMAVFGRLKAAEATYEHALKSALSNPSNFTIYAEGLGIEADMLATMRPDKMKAALQRLRKDYETLVKYNIPQPAMRIFDPWPEMISGLESAKKEEQIQVLQRLSRSVPML